MVVGVSILNGLGQGQKSLRSESLKCGLAKLRRIEFPHPGKRLGPKTRDYDLELPELDFRFRPIPSTALRDHQHEAANRIARTDLDGLPRPACRLVVLPERKPGGHPSHLRQIA